MREIVGHRFSVADVSYLIVDVLNVAGEVMVYAEVQVDQRRPRRAAFHYDDIADLIDMNEIA